MTQPPLSVRGDAEGGVGGAVHGVLGVEHEVEDDLLELALVALDAGEGGVEGRSRRGPGRS